LRIVAPYLWGRYGPGYLSDEALQQRRLSTSDRADDGRQRPWTRRRKEGGFLEIRLHRGSINPREPSERRVRVNKGRDILWVEDEGQPELVHDRDGRKCRGRVEGPREREEQSD